METLKKLTPEDIIDGFLQLFDANDSVVRVLQFSPSKSLGRNVKSILRVNDGVNLWPEFRSGLEAIRKPVKRKIWPKLDSWKYDTYMQILSYGYVEHLSQNSEYNCSIENNNASIKKMFVSLVRHCRYIQKLLDANENYCDERDIKNPKEFVEWAFSKNLHIPSNVVKGLDLINDKTELKQHIPKLLQQENMILDLLKKQGYDPKRLPKGESGKKGVRSEIRGLVNIPNSLFQSDNVFKTAWQRLLNNRETQSAD